MTWRIRKDWRAFLRPLNGLAICLVLISVALVLGGRSYGQSGGGFTPNTLLVAHQLTNGSTVISQLTQTGRLLKRFGTLPGTSSSCCMFPTEFRPHLALSGEFLYRSNGTYSPAIQPGAVDTISQFNSDGTLIATIIPTTSPQHEIVPIARDFADALIYMVDIFGSTNVIWHLNNPLTGASSGFAGVFYTGVAGITDLYFGGPEGSRALYALTATSPFITPCVVPGCANRVAKIDSTGTVTFFDNPELTLPFIFDVGRVAVDPNNGNIYVATTTKIVGMNASGAALGSFSFPFGFDGKPSLDVNSDGNILVGRFNSTTGEIDVFSPSGTLVSTIFVPDATHIFGVLIVRP